MAVKKPQHRSTENTVEKKYTTNVNTALNDAGKDVLSSLWKDLLNGSSKNLSEQLQVFGSTENELRPGEAVHLKKNKDEEKKISITEGHMEYFRQVKNADSAPARQIDAHIDRRVEEIRMEIKQLLKTSKQLETTFKSVAVETKVVKAGRYHETFFTFVLSLLRSARIKLEEGSSWASMAKGKKQQKGYWSMAKSHGTSFTMNNERSLATQTG